MKRLENSIRRPLPILLLKLSRTVRVTYSRNFKKCNYATLVFQNSILYNSVFLLNYFVTSQNTFLIWDGEPLRFYDKMLQINLLNLWPWLPSTIADGIQVEAPQYELTKTPQLWFYKKNKWRIRHTTWTFKWSARNLLGEPRDDSERGFDQAQSELCQACAAD